MNAELDFWATEKKYSFNDSEQCFLEKVQEIWEISRPFCRNQDTKLRRRIMWDTLKANNAAFQLGQATNLQERTGRNLEIQSHQADKNRCNCTQVLLQRIYSDNIMFVNQCSTKHTVSAAWCRCIRPVSWHLGNNVARGEQCNCSTLGNEVKLGWNITRRCGRAWHQSWLSTLPVPLKAECFVSQCCEVTEQKVQSHHWVP